MKQNRKYLPAIIIVGFAFVLLWFYSQTKFHGSAGLGDRRPMICVEGELYLDTGKEMPVEIDSSAIIGKITSSVDASEIPKEEGQSNFGNVGAKYARCEDGIAILLNHEWWFYEPLEDGEE